MQSSSLKLIWWKVELTSMSELKDVHKRVEHTKEKPLNFDVHET